MVSFTVKTLLNRVKYNVSTHERGRDMYDYQEGRGIMEVEKPQLKIKMTGVYHVLFICRGRETSIIGGGGGGSHIHIFVLCPINFF